MNSKQYRTRKQADKKQYRARKQADKKQYRARLSKMAPAG